MEQLIGSLTAIGTLRGSLSASGSLGGTITVPSIIGSLPYEGEYEFTPTVETQIIEINGLRATSNITINAIPRNYGLVEWNGNGIKIS